MARLAPFLALIAIGAAWGLTTPLVKTALEAGHRPLGIVLWQAVIVLAVVGPLQFRRGRPLPLGRAELRLYAVIGLMGISLPHLASFAANAHLPSGVVSIVISLVPIFAFPIALATGAERFGWRRMAGLTLGAAAIVLLVAPGTSLPPGAQAVFVLVAALAPLLYALEGAYIAGRGSRRATPLQALLGGTVVALALSLPAALATGAARMPGPPGMAEAAIVAAGLLSLAAYGGYFALLRSAGAVFAAQVAYVVTGSGVLWAMLLLGERYSGWVWAALGLMLAGLFLVQPRPVLAPPDAPPGPAAGPAATGA